MNVEHTVVLPCAIEHAFELFTNHASEWWPANRRHTGDPASTIRMEPLGRFWERATDGREAELGLVRTWEAPRRIVLEFYIGTGSERPTEATIHFEPEGEGTRVTVTHRPLAASEAIWAEFAPRFVSSWEVVFEALARFERTPGR